MKINENYRFGASAIFRQTDFCWNTRSFWNPCGEAFFEDAEALRSRIGVAEEDGDVVAGRRDRWQVAMGVSRAEWKIHHEK